MSRNPIKSNPNTNSNKALGSKNKKGKEFSLVDKLPLLTYETPKGSFLSAYDPLSSL
jgi:hypothetical protein